jgi:hypoxanthine phosphoribosyltransferase
MIFDYKIFLDYSDVVSLTNKLIEDADNFKPDMIVGMGRGGFVPAVHLSHALGVPLEPMMWQTRDGGVQCFSGPVEEDLMDGKRVVFVDDINDSGRTFKEVMDEYSRDGKYDDQIKTLCLVEKVSSSFRCSSAGIRLDDPRWIVFPWEGV